MENMPLQNTPNPLKELRWSVDRINGAPARLQVMQSGRPIPHIGTIDGTLVARRDEQGVSVEFFSTSQGERLPWGSLTPNQVESMRDEEDGHFFIPMPRT